MSICCNSSFTALAWDSGASAALGEQVVAVGYPRSSSSSVTATIGQVKDDWVGATLGYISHDAPLNPGNSGGPLFSMEGKVLGVNTAGSTVTEGLFYAVPYSTIEDDVADWRSRLVVTTEPSPTPVPSIDLAMSGTGDATELVALAAGRYIATATIANNCSTYSCDSLFAITMESVLSDDLDYESWWTTEGSYIFLLNVGDSDTESHERELLEGTQLVAITAEGSWTLSFAHPESLLDTVPTVSQTISGDRDATEFITLGIGRYVVTATIADNCTTYGCDSLFAITMESVLSDDLDYESWWTTEGSYVFLLSVENSDTASYRRDLIEGQQLVTVTAEGSWTITFAPQ